MAIDARPVLKAALGSDKRATDAIAALKAAGMHIVTEEWIGYLADWSNELPGPELRKRVQEGCNAARQAHS
jgi:hypothetical protein